MALKSIEFVSRFKYHLFKYSNFFCVSVDEIGNDETVVIKETEESFGSCKLPLDIIGVPLI